MSAVVAPHPAAAPPAATPDPPASPTRRRIGAALLFLAGAWVAFVVAHRLLSGRWWRWLLPELVPPPAFVLVPALLLLLALAAGPARRRVALLAVAALLLGADLSGFNPAVLRTPPPAPADALRLVSWNTTVWNHDDDPDRFYALLTARRADVYLLQEYKPADDPAARDADLARLRREFPGYQVAARGELVTLTRFPIVGVTALPADPPPGSDWRTDYWEVKSLRTDLRIGTRTVSVYNTHILVPLDLSSPLRATFHRRRHEFFQRRQVQYDAIAADLDRNPLPAVVAGDLNTSPAMADLDRLTDRLTDAGRASGSAYPRSWAIGGQRWWRLDWTFVSADWTVHRYWLRDVDGMSDHRMQESTLSLGGDR
ncbi:endonuclease/exonuclease/phosphatase family protein [Micromonospora coxensis]|uniref:endonuclease/exonuclease/phosphatase family protein n=1 Tax=Micromonospora coxensis TaxID=356852 RepID=UPI000B5AF9AA|nr:endonuclease/exonuclease/phosphatase family protein [Micromonospora coxensis]